MHDEAKKREVQPCGREDWPCLAACLAVLVGVVGVAYTILQCWYYAPLDISPPFPCHIDEAFIDFTGTRCLDGYTKYRCRVQAKAYGMTRIVQPIITVCAPTASDDCYAHMLTMGLRRNTSIECVHTLDGLIYAPQWVELYNASASSSCSACARFWLWFAVLSVIVVTGFRYVKF